MPCAPIAAPNTKTPRTGGFTLSRRAVRSAARAYGCQTGTARKFSSTGGYSRRYLSFFAGLVPVENPRFSMVVVVDDPDPGKGYFGGLVSAPVFKSVMEGALRLMDVAPDDIDTWLAAQADAEAKRTKANGGRPAKDAPVLPALAQAGAALPTPVAGGAP